MESNEASRRTFSASLIGFGYWGPNLARNLATSTQFELACICDVDQDRLELAQHLPPSVKCSPDGDAALSDPEIDVVFIATPAGTHYALGRQAILNGKHVLIEKPLTLDTASSSELVDLAERQGVALAVDHTFVFTGAVQKLRQLVMNGDLGDLRYFDSIRVNLGLIQPDINVLWDLAIHDLAILQYVTGTVPVAVSATGIAHAPSIHASTAYMTLFFENDFIAHIGTSWMSPVKVRRALLGGTDQMVVYDDLERSEKIKIFDSTIEESSTSSGAYTRLVQPRIGDMLAPKVSTREALAVEIEHFGDHLLGETDLLVPGTRGMQVIRILEAATESMKENGVPVPVAGESS